MKKLLFLSPSNSRKIALSCIYTVCRTQEHIQAVLSSHFIQYKPEQSNIYLITELVYGYIRYKIRIDAILEHFFTSTSSLPSAYKYLISFAVYEILYMESSLDASVVFHSVEVVKSRYGKSLSGVANAVLRKVIREKTEILKRDFFCSIGYSLEEAEALHFALPLHMWQKMKKDYGAEAYIYAESFLLRPTFIEYIPVKTYLFSSVRTRRKEREVSLVSSSFSVLSPAKQYKTINSSALELFSVLEVERISGMVWDCCSGRGGKYLALRLFGIEALIVSDISLARLRKNTVFGKTLKMRIDASMAPFKEGSFGCIVADVPCSGTGTLRKRPDIKLHREELDIVGLCEIQRKILDNIALLVHTGGHILYCTCSIYKEENEIQIQAFLARNPAYILKKEYSIPATSKMNDFFYGALLQRRSPK